MFLLQTKMNFPLKNNRINKHNGFFGIPVYIIAAVVALLIVSNLFFPNFNKSLGYYISKPIWFLRDNTGHFGKNFFAYFTSKNTLYTDNENLKNENMTLKLRAYDYETILSENQELKGITLENTNKIISRILSKPPQSPYDTLVIGNGSSQGISVGDRVYLSDTVVVGTVTSVTSGTSLVTLFSSDEQKTTGENTRTGVSFEIIGKGASNLTITIPKETDILWGDTFVYPAVSPEVIGSVYYIDTESQTSFKTAYLRIPANISSAKWIFVNKRQ